MGKPFSEETGKAEEVPIDDSEWAKRERALDARWGSLNAVTFAESLPARRWLLCRNKHGVLPLGKTGMLVGRWHGAFVHLPIEIATHGRAKVNPGGDLWHAVLESSGQPARLC